MSMGMLLGKSSRLGVALIALTALNDPAAKSAEVLAPGIHANVRFNDYPPLARAEQVTSRYMSPLVAEAVRRRLASSGTVLQPQLLDISAERFLVYVPSREPVAGYGLLVFIPPWPAAQLPASWRAVLDKFGVLLVSADRSGNEENVLGRRLPLALAALANMQQRFRIDPSRTVIGGFSGGSRLAMRVALDYPDQFSGAFLNAGSDAIEKSPVALPGAALFQLFQDRAKIAYVTGDQDEASETLDDLSQASMRHWCVGGVASFHERGAGHEIADAAATEWAFTTLFSATRADQRSVAKCRNDRAKEVSDALLEVETALRGRRQNEARRLLLAADAKYGGLAAPRSIELADRCACGILDDRRSPADH